MSHIHLSFPYWYVFSSAITTQGTTTGTTTGTTGTTTGTTTTSYGSTYGRRVKLQESITGSPYSFGCSIKIEDFVCYIIYISSTYNGPIQW